MVSGRAASAAPWVRRSLRHRLLPPQPRAVSSLARGPQVDTSSVKDQMSAVATCIYELIRTYMNTKGKIPGVCSRKEGTRSPPAILPTRSLGLNSFTLKWKGHKHRAQNLPSTHTSRLKQFRGGPYWAWESRRRHFNRIGAQGLLVSRESPGEGRRCHRHLRPWSQASKVPPPPVQFPGGAGKKDSAYPTTTPSCPKPLSSLWGRLLLFCQPGPRRHTLTRPGCLGK